MTNHESVSLDAAESRFQDALRRNDLEELDGLLHENVRFVGPDGMTIDKATDLAAHRSGSLVFAEVFELQREVQVFDSVGVTRATLRLVGEAGGERLDADLAYTRTWQKLHDTWTIVAAHGSVVPRREQRHPS
ncbi:MULTISPECIES: nuclear transport factor 2 family protein [unclassified Diaminobutyricimonas]|uniref:nuclear transport factor 2 family protein n=1 Tax=unclassified Diaminobutyricimonas TaxID=2643261 RepID=UPI0012F50338|nr:MULTISPECIES: nuclear transport factor 2 family protein [unclassified Diaminobutyricimonas]